MLILWKQKWLCQRHPFGKSLLENAEIETFLLNENTGTIAPWYASAGGLGAVKVVVSNLDFDKAKIIIDEYKNK